MTWPIVEGTSLMHLHISRGKRSIVLDLRTDEGRAVFLDLVAGADAVIEAMRPGGLDKRGVGYEACRAVNPRIVFCTISGYGMTGPYKDMPSHGIAYDVWAGLVAPEITDDGFCAIPEHPSVGIHAGPLFGALGVLAGITRARATGEPCRLEIAQSDAAAAMDWLRSETWKAYERPESEVTGNKADGYERRAPGTAGMRDGVRYQFYETADGHVLFMASEREFWENFCQRHRPRRPLRAAPRLAVRRPRPRQHGAAHRAGGDLPQPHHGRVDRPRQRRQHADRAGQHAQDAGRRPAVPGPPPVDPAGAGRARAGAVADQGPRRGAPAADQGADGGRAHRGGPAGGPRLRRRADRRPPCRGRAGLTGPDRHLSSAAVVSSS